MGTRMNPLAGRYFNDPSFAQAFSNLASAFAPPGADEMLGYEQFRGEKAENERLSALWDSAGGDFDRMGMASGQWAPTQSLYAVDTADATNRRGQDITADVNMRGQDIGLAQAYATTPLETTEAIPGLPDEIAAALGLPGFAPVAGGDIGAAPKPMSETEVKGQFMQDVRESGGLTDEDIWALTMGGTPTVNTVGEGGEPRVQFSPEAARSGAEAYVNPGSTAAADFGNYKGPNGEEGAYRTDPSTGQLLDAATGEPLPQGVTLYKLEGGSKDDATGATNSNVTDYNRLQATVAQSDMLIDSLKGLVTTNAGAAGTPGALQSMAQNVMQIGREFDQVFGTNVDGIVSPEMISQMGQAADGPYNPAFQQIRSGVLELAYLNAKAANPSGEVSRFALERQLEALGQGMLGNDQSFLAALDWTSQSNKRRLAAAEAMIGNAVPAVPGATPAAPVTPVPAQPGAGMQPVAVPSDPLAEARAAIQRGADPEKVKARLRENGIDPGGL